MDACPEAMEAAPCSLTYDLKRFFKQQGNVFWTFLRRVFNFKFGKRGLKLLSKIYILR
jgi:hypothetical protein